MTACAVGAIVTTAFGVIYWRARQQTIDTARGRARAEAVRAAQVIDNELKRFQAVVDAVAADFSGGRVKRDQIGVRLRAAVDTTPQLSGIGAAFVELAYDPQIRLYAPYVQRRGDGAEMV